MYIYIYIYIYLVRPENCQAVVFQFFTFTFSATGELETNGKTGQMFTGFLNGGTLENKS